MEEEKKSWINKKKKSEKRIKNLTNKFRYKLKEILLL